MKKRQTAGHSQKLVQNVFVLLLLSLFAILSTFLVTVGAQLYRKTVDSAEKNNNTRIMTAVVRSAIWAEDGGQVTVEKLGDGMTALSVMHDYGGEIWVKRLYAYDGYLLESFTLYEDEDGDGDGFDPEYGESLCELSRFEPSLEGNLLTVELETKDHQTSTVRMFMRAGGAAE